jgi:heavy metal translocating P-type ATPase
MKTEAKAVTNWNRTVAALSATAILVHLSLRVVVSDSTRLVQLPLFVALILGGIPLIGTLGWRLLSGQFGSDFLAGVSIVTSVILREYLVGTIVILMLSGGSALEAFATRRASRALEVLSKQMPTIAHRRSKETVEDVPVADVAVGDELVIYPHEICPVDGTVLQGHGSMNEAYLTGEPFEVEKAPGSAVLSGAVNGESLISVRAERLAKESRYARIMQVMEETEQRRPQMRRIADMLGAWYTPLAIGVAIAAWAFSGSEDRFLAVLVIATPCPLLIAIPVAVIGAISLSARHGIIIKNPAILEQISLCRTFIFDKTGTLTYGRPKLKRLVCSNGFSEVEVLTLVGSIERYSKHPLARAIIDAARERSCEVWPVAEVSEVPGHGLQGIVKQRTVVVTGRSKVAEEGLQLPPIEPGLECLAFVDGRLAGLFGFEDGPRSDSRVFVDHLSPRHSVTRVLLVSGDRESEVSALAKQVGIVAAYGAKSPEEKVELVRSETALAKTVFVGDGINDAPAMQAATVGIAFGHENEITCEAADAVVLDRSMGKVDELLHIGRRMRRIAFESAIGGMILSAIGMAFAAAGLLPAVWGAVTQEVIDLIAVLNAVRVILPIRALRDF